jgi:hypothetical protein
MEVSNEDKLKFANFVLKHKAHLYRRFENWMMIGQAKEKQEKKQTDLSKMNKSELQDYARYEELEFTDSNTKAELIEMIHNKTK